MNYQSCLCLLIFCLIATTNAASDQDLDPANDPKNIHRPCVGFDIDCVRNYFSANSECTISRGPVPDPLYIKYYQVDIPNVNWTGDVHDVNVEGLNGDITEFYVNKETNKMVLAVEMHGLRVSSSNVVIKYRRKAKESLERCGSIDYKYDKVTMTAEIPTNCELNMRNAEISTFVDDGIPGAYVDPSIGANLDQESKRRYKKFIDDSRINLQEIFVRQGAAYMSIYIQRNICDFGLDTETFNCPNQCS